MDRLASKQIELDRMHMKQCAAGCPIATGAFGKTYLGLECELSLPFVIKTIDLIRCDEAALDEFRSCVQQEIGVSSLSYLGTLW